MWAELNGRVHVHASYVLIPAWDPVLAPHSQQSQTFQSWPSKAAARSQGNTWPLSSWLSKSNSLTLGPSSAKHAQNGVGVELYGHTW